MTRYSIIHKNGTETAYVWCDKAKQMVIQKPMTKTAVIYSNGSQECEHMAALLQALGGEFHEYILGKHFTDKAFHDEFGNEATYPQIAYGSQHLGSMKEALQYLKEIGAFK